MKGRVEIVVVDDDMNDANVNIPILDTIIHFCRLLELSSFSNPVWLNDVALMTATLGFEHNDLWGVLVVRGTLPRDIGEDIELEVRVIAFDRWGGAVKCLDQIYPRVVLTDLYEGIIENEDDLKSVRQLPGRKFAERLLESGIPTIVFSSSTTTLESFRAEWQHLSNQHDAMLFYFDRKTAFVELEAADALRKIWDVKISATIWNPEFNLSVRGERNDGVHSITFFQLSDGKRLSHREVTPSVYVHYYLWAHASQASLFWEWDDYETPREERKCPVLGAVRDYRSSSHSQSQTNGVEPGFNEDLKAKYKHPRSKALLANIDHFDVPASDIPVYFEAKDVAENLYSSLAPVLCKKGVEWLRSRLARQMQGSSIATDGQADETIVENVGRTPELVAPSMRELVHFNRQWANFRDEIRSSLTVVIMDLGGSSGLATALGTEIAHEIKEQFRNQVREVADAWGAFPLNQWAGDATALLFLHVEHAVSYAMSMIHTTTELRRQLAKDQLRETDPSIARGFRVAVAKGDVFFNRSTGVCTGRTLDVAGHMLKDCEAPGLILTRHIYEQELPDSLREEFEPKGPIIEHVNRTIETVLWNAIKGSQ